MPGRLDGEAIKRLRAIASGGNPSDEALVSCFVSRGDGAEEAFASLVDRHGPAVFRVCRAMLGEEQSARDAFQATFLVLARKAGTLRVVDSIQPWLLSVAVRVSASARASEARRRRHEGGRFAAEAQPSDDQAERREVVELVRDEVARLPDRLRAAVVACDLEGLGHEQAARRLGWPIGTVKSRQARGRERLRARLSRRGMAFGSVIPFRAFSKVPGVSAGLVRETVRSALAFKGGVGVAGVVSASVSTLVRIEEGGMRLFQWATFSCIAIGISAFGLASAWSEVPIDEPEDEVTLSRGSALRQEDEPEAIPRPPAPVELHAVALAGTMRKVARDEQGDGLIVGGAARWVDTPVSMVAIVAEFTQGAYQAELRASGLIDRDRVDLPYLRVDLQRQQRDPDGSWSGWATINPEARREVFRDVKLWFADRMPAKVRSNELVDAIPLLYGPHLEDDTLHAAGVVPCPPPWADRVPEHLRSELEVDSPRIQVGPPLNTSERGEGSAEEIRSQRIKEPVLMIRATDCWIVPSETYRYRVRVVMQDPQPLVSGRRELPGEWSAPTKPIEAAALPDRDKGRRRGDPNG